MEIWDRWLYSFLRRLGSVLRVLHNVSGRSLRRLLNSDLEFTRKRKCLTTKRCVFDVKWHFKFRKIYFRSSRTSCVFLYLPRFSGTWKTLKSPILPINVANKVFARSDKPCKQSRDSSTMRVWTSPQASNCRNQREFPPPNWAFSKCSLLCFIALACFIELRALFSVEAN